MGKTLSEDLRIRVIRTVEEGLSCRAAGERFGIGVATAIRWVRVWRDTGASSAKRKGGDLRSQRIEAFRAEILAAVEAKKDITLIELAELLEREYGARFAPSTIWRFFARHRISFKKKPRTPPSRVGRTWPRGGKPGSKRSRILIPSIWSLSMRPERARRWRACAAAHHAASAAGQRFRMGIGRLPPLPARCGCRE